MKLQKLQVYRLSSIIILKSENVEVIIMLYIKKIK